MIAANTIYVFSKGASLCLAQLLLFRLRRFKMKVVIMPSSGSEIFEILPNITNKDLVFLFCFEKTSIEAHILLDYCHQIQCKTIIMSSRILDDQENNADYHLYVYRGEKHEYHSMAAPIAYLDALIVEIARKGDKEYMEAIDEMYQLKEKYKTKIQR